MTDPGDAGSSPVHYIVAAGSATGHESFLEAHVPRCLLGSMVELLFCKQRTRVRFSQEAFRGHLEFLRVCKVPDFSSGGLPGERNEF